MQSATARNFDAVLFDMDGTLVESEEYHARSWKKVIENFGHALPEPNWLDRFVGTTDGETRDAVIVQFPDLADKGDILAIKQGLFLELIAGNGDKLAMPGIVPPLGRLSAAGVPMAVGTNGVLANCRTVLGAAGLLRFFSILSTVDQVKRGKPAPDIYCAAAERLGFAPERCAVVEDSAVGARSGKAAGCFVVGIDAPNSPQTPEGADIVFPTPALALEWLACGLE